jgi:phage tail sheath gpL-like
MVPFNVIPSNLLVPLFYAEFNSGGTPYLGDPVPLLVGQMTTDGKATPEAAYGPIRSESDAIAQFGLGSMLHYMFLAARANAEFVPIYALPLADPPGTAAHGSITITTAPGISGAGVVRVAGRLVQFQVNAADTAAMVATSMAAMINMLNLPVTATAAADVCTVTFRHKGLAGNGLDLAIPGSNGVPSGGWSNCLNATNATIAPLATGTGTPDVAGALAKLEDTPYDWIASAYTDQVSLDAFRAFLSDATGRWSPYQQLFGHMMAFQYDTLSNLAEVGPEINSQHVTVMGSMPLPTPPWEPAAGLAAKAAEHLANPPECSRPLQTLVLAGVLPPDLKANWWTISDRQALYMSGVGAIRVQADFTVEIDRCATTYLTDAAGAQDRTFADMETMGQGMYAIRYLRNMVLSKYGRSALAQDDPYNVGMATPKRVRMDLIHMYNDLVALGLAQRGDIFAQYVVVEINALNPQRLDVYLPLNVVNQLRVFAANVTAYLSFTTPSGGVAIPALAGAGTGGALTARKAAAPAAAVPQPA